MIFPKEINGRTNKKWALKKSIKCIAKEILYAPSCIWNKLPLDLKWVATSFLSRNLTKCNRFVVNSHNLNGRINGPLTGTFYIPSEVVEQSAIGLLKDKAIDFSWNTSGNVIRWQVLQMKNLASNSIDYVFTDPPFGQTTCTSAYFYGSPG